MEVVKDAIVVAIERETRRGIGAAKKEKTERGDVRDDFERTNEPEEGLNAKNEPHGRCVGGGEKQRRDERDERMTDTSHKTTHPLSLSLSLSHHKSDSRESVVVARFASVPNGTRISLFK